MRMTGTVKTTLALAALIALSGCAGGYDQGDRLRLQVDQFNDNVRWGRYFSAANFVEQEAREEWLTSRREWRSDDLRIADYEVVDSTMEDRETAIVRVVVSWYRLSQSEIQTTMFAQTWRKSGRIWHLADEEIEEGTPL